MDKIKIGALASYFGVIGIIISFAINSEQKSSFISFHLRQAVLITSIILCLNFMNLHLDSTLFRAIVWCVSIPLKIIGIYYAYNNEQKNIPFIGEYAQKWFKNI